MTITDDDLRRLIELADRVGPWVDDVNIHINAPECVMRSQQERWDTEIEFARAARNALPDIAIELIALRERVRWRPIDTAPKDGTAILLAIPGWRVPQGARFDSEKWVDCEGLAFTSATHWMPLPEPPSTSPRREEGRATGSPTTPSESQ